MTEVGRIRSPETSIQVYSRESKHRLPHFHARSKGESASFTIETLEKLNGFLPPNTTRAVLKWARPRSQELLTAWNDLQSGKKVGKIP